MAPSWFVAHLVACGILSSVQALQLPNYVGLKTSQNNSILDITFHNPNSTLNFWNQDTTNGLTDIVAKLQKDNETKVVVFRSDVPRYWIGHLDLTMPDLTETWPSYAELIYNISALPQVTIGAVEGRARGIGNEFLVSLDMRFATKNDTLIGQPEVGSGLIPGGGGSQFLPGLIGRGLAMEYILSAKDISASEAEKIGWINKAFDTSAEMNTYIDGLTSRLRLFPQQALASAKKSINRRTAPKIEDTQPDASAFVKRLEDPVVQALSAKTAAVYQKSSAFEIELDLGNSLLQLYQ
ncbi:ClpP/crotonase [Alternaria alternata]|uniref:ClpP/crotonase n=1 Tax=Alternaria alternata TaxID=5599 RepID=A0A177DH24_ALTAL|nr:ClpP/crotonase [Alternaria alternata]OAG18648.1 ClpP/crotonase [Alternaria alternata]